MAPLDLSRAEWLMSSRSSQDGNCVEVARNLPGLVVVRDSKRRDGLVLVFGSRQWTSFVAAAKAGAFDTA
jgi:uncharacterized protein DUF397